MKQSYLTFHVISIILFGILSGCNTPTDDIERAEENVAQAEEKLSEAKDDYLLDVENFKKETDTRILANEASIDEFKSLMINSKREVKNKYEKEIAELEKRNTAMKTRLFEYKDEGKDKWTEFKKEFDRDMNELVNAFKKAGNSYGLHYS